MQEFTPQLSQHHPFGLAAHETVAAAHHQRLTIFNTSINTITTITTITMITMIIRSTTTAVTSRSSHTPTATFMHETVGGYSGLNGQSLGYNVHVSADKNLVLPGLAGHAGLGGHGLGAPGNLQPGYLPRPVETSSLSCDSELEPSTGIGLSCSNCGGSSCTSKYPPSPSFHFLLSLSNTDKLVRRVPSTKYQVPSTNTVAQGTQAKE